VPVAAWKNARTAARPRTAEAIGDSRNPSPLVCAPIQDSGVPTAPDPMNPAEVHHPGSAGRAAMQWGQVVDDARFARDEMANMVWAIENVLENAAGQPWPQHERDAARTGAWSNRGGGVTLDRPFQAGHIPSWHESCESAALSPM
jgi:hypothetical protein